MVFVNCRHRKSKHLHSGPPSGVHCGCLLYDLLSKFNLWRHIRIGVGVMWTKVRCAESPHWWGDYVYFLSVEYFEFKWKKTTEFNINLVSIHIYINIHLYYDIKCTIQVTFREWYTPKLRSIIPHISSSVYNLFCLSFVTIRGILVFFIKINVR